MLRTVPLSPILMVDGCAKHNERELIWNRLWPQERRSIMTQTDPKMCPACKTTRIVVEQECPNFKFREFACRHCGHAHCPPQALRALQQLRDRCGFPFVLRSAYRCPNHPDEVKKSTGPGHHSKGHAFDIAVKGKRAWFLLAHATALLWYGVGVHQTGKKKKRFLHVDLRKGPWVWGY